MNEINKPYVKQYDKEGNLLNPINGAYKNNGTNRNSRKIKFERFTNNRNTVHLTVTKTAKFIRSLQLEFKEDGTLKKIFHYNKLKSI